MVLAYTVTPSCHFQVDQGSITVKTDAKVRCIRIGCNHYAHIINKSYAAKKLYTKMLRYSSFISRTCNNKVDQRNNIKNIILQMAA